MKRVPFRLLAVMVLVGLLAPLGLLGLRTPATFPVEARASSHPDQITLTPGEDPATCMTVQWRTDTTITAGVIRYAKKAALDPRNPVYTHSAPAETLVITYPSLLRSKRDHKHVARLEDLEPATTYCYAIDGEVQGPSYVAKEFTTAPQGASAFSFLSIGDIQKGSLEWPALFQKAKEIAPDAAFCISVGDIVDKAAREAHWDQFHYYSGGIFAQLPLVPVIGNHDIHRKSSDIYLKHFALPRNGPEPLASGRAYTVRYGQALIVALDSNLPADTQTAWLEEQLSTSDAVWKFAVFHHPAFSTHPKRDNLSIREEWGRILEAQGVDLVFQGHDHAYLRTNPMKGGKAVPETEQGTVYLLSVFGKKYYDAEAPENAAKLISNTSTFQVIDITTHPDQLTYSAYTADGTQVDSFTITK